MGKPNSGPRKVHNLSGFPENLPEEQILEEKIKAAMREVYTLFGYVPLETPAVESMDALAPDYDGADIGKEIYTIQRAAAEGDSEKDSRRGLRFDLTVPLARYVAQHYGSLTFPFKRSQIQKVWRGERPQKGRFREFYQADIDVIAENTLPLHYDAEVVQVIHKLLSRIDIGNFTVHINHRKLLQGLLEGSGIKSEQVPDALRIIDKIEKVGVDVTKESLMTELSLSKTNAQQLLALLDSQTPITEVARFLDQIEGDNELLREGKEEITTVANLLSSTSNTTGKVVLNPRIARGLDYYTGCVYETTIDGLEQYGSICSGGRYANLADRFTNKSLPGVGISIGLSRLLSIVKEEKLIPMDQKTTTQLLIGLFNEEQRTIANDVASQVREAGIATEVYHDGTRRLSKQIKLAEQKGIPNMLLLNEDGSFELKKIKEQIQSTHSSIEDVLNQLTK